MIRRWLAKRRLARIEREKIAAREAAKQQLARMALQNRMKHHAAMSNRTPDGRFRRVAR